MAKRAAVLVRAVRSAKAATPAASDKELLRRFAEAGDQSAFAAVTERHAGMVLGVCKRVLHSQADAEDACQAVFLILARKAGGNRWQASVANWLYATARKVAGNARVAASRRTKREGAAAVAEAVSPADTVTGPEVLAALDEELERLPPRYREPLVLCYLEGLTRDEAATRLGVPEATLKSQLERGRKKLADALTARGCALGVALLLTATSSAGASPPRLVESIRAAAGGSPSPAALALAKGVAVNRLAVRTKLVALAALAAAVTGFGFSSATDARPQKAADKMEKPAAKADAPKAGVVERTVSGTVLGTDGKPAAGLPIFHPTTKVPRPTSMADIVVKEVARTDAAGKFRVTLSGKSPRDYLIAHAPGTGLDWVEPAGEVTMRLVPDVPIRGRMLTTEGKPAADVRVTVVGVYVPANNKLDDYLAGWKASLREAMASPQKRLYCPLDGITGTATTDADGRFTLSGVGGERIVHLVVEGGGTARQNPMVITRSGFDPKPYNELLLQKEHDALRELNFFRGLNGPDLTLVAERGKLIEGTVTDAATGKPVAGAGVSTATGFGDAVGTVTGADGKYRLDGVPKRTKGYGVHVRPPDGVGYMAASGGALDTDGYTPVRHDIKLSKGVVVTGRVIDKQTGKGVPAGVRLAPLPGNPYFGKGPGSDSYRSDRTMASTDKDGRFRITTIPGKSLLMVQAQGDDKFNGEYLNPYRRAEPDPNHKELFKYDADDDSWTLNAVDNSIEFLSTEHAVRVLDLKETGETVVEMTLDRGRTARIEVQDANGKPLTGAFVAGMTAAWPVTYKLPESACTIYALNPDRPRTIGVYHPAMNLGGLATIRGDEKEPVVVKLGPAGTVTGRFTDEDGVPLSGAEITVNARNRVFSELYRFTVKDRPKTVTDAKGQFMLPAIVPGMEFYIQIRKGEQYFGGKPKLGLINLKPGETKAFGDRTLEVLR